MKPYKLPMLLLLLGLPVPMRAALVALCLAPWSAMAAEVGDVLKPVTLRDVDDKTTATPRNKVIALFYTDPDAHELTDLLFERIKTRRFDKRFYETVVVVNMEDSKIPGFLISAGVTSESQKGKATFLFDDELTAAKTWRLGDCNSDSVFIIMGTDSTVKYIHRGEMREAEITAVLELIDSLIAEAKAAATSP
jgi:predicted transcriptional regulator